MDDPQKGAVMSDWPEPYITRTRLAERMGVSVQTVDRMRRAGMPSVQWGRRTRRFLASECIRWAIAQDNPGMSIFEQRNKEAA